MSQCFAEHVGYSDTKADNTSEKHGDQTHDLVHKKGA
jgi:hypothetical protein